MKQDNPPPYHPAVSQVANYLIKELNEAQRQDLRTSALHIMSLLKDVAQYFPKHFIKVKHYPLEFFFSYLPIFSFDFFILIFEFVSLDNLQPNVGKHEAQQRPNRCNLLLRDALQLVRFPTTIEFSSTRVERPNHQCPL